ncbi:MAG: leucyl/phenylalanyl-tRNA--protein transferase [Holophaga sp.]|jgi:leucyl/phenylalanyl-tRNA--protein transferase
MPVRALGSRLLFPDPRKAAPDGLLAVGGDLTVSRLLKAYASGIFPWYGEDSPILWWSPPTRAVFLPGDDRLPRRSRRALRGLDFQVRRDTCFEAVIESCARIPRRDQGGTWITEEMCEAYVALHREGYAHSFETFRGDHLVGGLYGVSLGAAFFGESMFTQESYASRAAFAELCRTLWSWGFQLIDGQLPNPNLDDLGARVVSREEYLERLERALEQPTRWGPWTAR